MFEYPGQYPLRDRARQPRPRAVLHPGQIPGSGLSGEGVLYCCDRYPYNVFFFFILVLFK